MMVALIPIVVDVFGMVHERLGKGTGRTENQEESRSSGLQHCLDRPEYLEEP